MRFTFFSGYHGTTMATNDMSPYKYNENHKKPDWVHVVRESIVTSWHGNTFRIMSPLWGESTGHRWIPLTEGQ